MKTCVYWLAVLGVVVLSHPEARAATLAEAREAEEAGRWDDAVKLWRDLVAAPTGASADREVAAGYLRALETTGRYAKVEEEAEELASRFPGWEVPVIRRARALAVTGRLREGAELLASVTGPSWEVMVEEAALRHRMGEHAAAERLTERVVESYSPVRSYSARELFAAASAARDQEDFEGAAHLFETAYRDSLDFLEARLALAYLFEEKYQDTLAGEELTEAASLAPNHPDVSLANAVIALRTSRLSRAEPAARAVLEIRPRDPGARGVLAYLALVADDYEEAFEWLEPALEDDPMNLEVRSLKAAAAYLDGDSTAYHEEVNRVLEQDGEYWDMFLELADILRTSRRHDEAFALYDRILRARPDHAATLIAKGLLLMREGEEEEARVCLEKGFEGDPFNIRAYNQLELLDEMDTFAVYGSDRFSIRLDAEKDSSLVPVLERSLDAIYDELVEKHGWKPRVPTIIEVFPSHDWFSARVTGLPWLGGIPAVCFGDVVAMDSPRTLAGGMNWEDMLRHEFGHVLALGMTNKKVPFWFTEGLSVFLEHFPREPSWDENLVGAYVDQNLVPLDSLTIAFTRPRVYSQRLLAYHESSLIIRDLVERKGWPVIPALLRQFGEGKTLDAALRSVVGESVKDLGERAMVVFREEARSLPVWPAPNRERLARLAGQADARADDPEFLEQLCLAQFQAQLLDDAAGTAKTLLEVDEGNARAYSILGLCSRTKGDPRGAQRLLTRAIELGTNDVPVHVALAEMAIASEDTVAALDHLSRALEIYPKSPEARHKRARLLAARGDIEDARSEYETLLAQSGNAHAAALELARIEIDAERGGPAAEALDYASVILPPDAEVEALRGRAYLLLDRDHEAYELLLKARKLQLRNVESMVGMAQYYLKHEDYEEAAYFAELALKYDPDHAAALDVLARARAE